MVPLGSALLDRSLSMSVAAERHPRSEEEKSHCLRELKLR